MTRQRLAVVRLFHGGLFSAPRGGAPKTVTFTVDDARRFIRELKPYRWDQGNALWGASLEALPKRAAHPAPIDQPTLDRLIAGMRSSRLMARAESLERQAESYMAQARYAQESAARLRAEVTALRAAVDVATTDG